MQHSIESREGHKWKGEAPGDGCEGHKGKDEAFERCGASVNEAVLSRKLRTCQRHGAGCRESLLLPRLGYGRLATTGSGETFHRKL